MKKINDAIPPDKPEFHVNGNRHIFYHQIFSLPVDIFPPQIELMVHCGKIRGEKLFKDLLVIKKLNACHGKHYFQNQSLIPESFRHSENGMPATLLFMGTIYESLTGDQCVYSLDWSNIVRHWEENYFWLGFFFEDYYVVPFYNELL